MKWASSFKEIPKQVFVCHGEDTACTTFARRLREELDYTAMAPYSGAVYDLKQGVFERNPEGIRIQQTVSTKYTEKPASAAYQRLLEAGRRLLGIIRTKEKANIKELEQFTRQVEKLCDRWF